MFLGTGSIKGKHSSSFAGSVMLWLSTACESGRRCSEPSKHTCCPGCYKQSCRAKHYYSSWAEKMLLTWPPAAQPRGLFRTLKARGKSPWYRRRLSSEDGMPTCQWDDTFTFLLMLRLEHFLVKGLFLMMCLYGLLEMGSCARLNVAHHQLGMRVIAYLHGQWNFGTG